MLRKHKNEITIQQLMNMHVGSRERKNFIDILRKKGNFLSPAQKEINLVKRPTKPVNPQNILPCEYCKGYYMKRYLKRHVLRCHQRPQYTNSVNYSVSDAHTYFAFRSLEDKFLGTLKLKENVLKMRSDEISLIVKSDPLILSFGMFYAKRHKHNHLSKVTRNKLREIARLWQNLKIYVNAKSLFEALVPDNFKHFVLCTQNITGFNQKTQEFTAPSLAMHMWTTLKQLCDHAFSELQQKNYFFVNGIDSIKKSKDIKTLRKIISSCWNLEISSVANQTLKEKQWKKPTIIPLTSDIQKLNKHVRAVAKMCIEGLEYNENDKELFNNLQKCCYTLLITFNRRRIGELERLLLENYLQESSTVLTEEFQESLSETEKILLKNYKRIRIRGKRHKPVPVLVPKEIQDYISILIKIRNSFIPTTNVFLFAKVNKDSCIDGYSALRNFAINCGAEYPQALTSCKLRKHIATISQVYQLDTNEVGQLASFLGHTLRTHED